MIIDIYAGVIFFTVELIYQYKKKFLLSNLGGSLSICIVSYFYHSKFGGLMHGIIGALIC
jgi:hypothetical protein